MVQVCVAALGLAALALVPMLTRTQASTLSAPKKAKGPHVATRQTRQRVRTSLVVSKSSASLGPLATLVQSLNNCGPASVSEVLGYWHIYRSEAQVATVLRADSSYWGMSPVGLPAYARSLGMRALVGYGGTERLVKLLIANGFPVIASQYVSASDPIRHYRPIEAYNDRTGLFTSDDPYLGAGHVISYAEFNAIWSESGYRFQVLYPPSLQARLNAVLQAAGWNKQKTYSAALTQEEQQMRTSTFQITGTWIWYNGYVDVAFDEAELGQFRRAQTALGLATRQGINPIVIGWVTQEIRFLQRHG